MKRKELGLSRYVLGFLGAFLVGVFCGDWFYWEFGYLAGIIGGLVGGAVMFYRDQYYRIVLISFLGLVLGFSYYQSWDFKENKKNLVYDTQLTATGIIVEKPEIDKDQKLIVAYQNTKILVQTAKYPRYNYGDALEIEGEIQNPKLIKSADDSNFNYGEYLLKKGIRGIIRNQESVKVVGSANNIKTKIYRVIFFAGDKFEESLARILAEPYAAFQEGLLLGHRSRLPDSLISAFNRTGTTHIVAVSGYNITIIISALAIFLMRYSRRLAFWGSLAAVLVFVILTGASASVVRAGLLAMLVAYGKTLGRRPYYPVLILWTAFLMVLFNPYVLKNDVSFQLSFLAFSGLIFIAPHLAAIKIIVWLPKIIKTTLAETLGAQILVLPILIYNFGVLSVVAPLVNVLILPTIPAAMGFGFAVGIAGMIYWGLGKIAGVASFILLKYIIIIVEFFSRFSWAAVSFPTDQWWWLPIYYVIIIVVMTRTARLKQSAESQIQ